MTGSDPEYLSWVRGQPCSVQPCTARAEAHHHTRGDVVAPGEKRPRKSIPGKRGKGQKAADYYAMPLCPKHHAQLHSLSGHFRGWDKATLIEWQDAQVVANRERYESRRVA